MTDDANHRAPATTLPREPTEGRSLGTGTGLEAQRSETRDAWADRTTGYKLHLEAIV
jgi:hypothetical protein